ncbi:MAG: Mannose-6-phosphate isomerase, class [Chitinophagaceae bacterium]|nr:Mannose-6-phosphate isomerase, class [Chitinophagaceae bacterium]
MLQADPVNGVSTYDIPADDFSLTRIQLSAGESIAFRSKSPEIILCVEGSATLQAKNELHAAKGDALIIFPDNDYTIKATGNSLLFRAAVP